MLNENDEYDSDISEENKEFDYSIYESNKINNVLKIHEEIKQRFWYINYTSVDLMNFISGSDMEVNHTEKYNKKYKKVLKEYENEINITYSLINSVYSIVLEEYEDFFYYFISKPFF